MATMTSAPAPRTRRRATMHHPRVYTLPGLRTGWHWGWECDCGAGDHAYRAASTQKTACLAALGHLATQAG